jgi:hypothetical protein
VHQTCDSFQLDHCSGPAVRWWATRPSLPQPAMRAQIISAAAAAHHLAALTHLTSLSLYGMCMQAVNAVLPVLAALPGLVSLSLIDVSVAMAPLQQIYGACQLCEGYLFHGPLHTQAGRECVQACAQALGPRPPTLCVPRTPSLPADTALLIHMLTRSALRTRARGGPHSLPLRARSG